jgi:2-dehydro-3-deoxyphosphooctonate aldolase (KDO 8-P synthase)
MIIIAGNCVIENFATTYNTAKFLKSLDMDIIFKASFEKANRTSAYSFTGLGIDKGLEILKKIKEDVDIKILTDVHRVSQISQVAEVVDYIQIPAFLCRQTKLIQTAAYTKKPINIKKGQFIAPEDVKFITEKIEAMNNKKITITERGTFFGYHDLVVDFRSFSILKKLGYQVIFDITHSVQKPSIGFESGGNKEYCRNLARAGIAYGIDGLYFECHPEPEKALSDSAVSLNFREVKKILKETRKIQNSCS